MNLVPTTIKRIVKNEGSFGAGLEISWSDGQTFFLDSTTLRQNCPCATCLENRGDATHQKPLKQKSSRLTILTATKEEETDLKQIMPVGNYAVSLIWGDKHDSGIYSFSFLHELSLGTKTIKAVNSPPQANT